MRELIKRLTPEQVAALSERELAEAILFALQERQNDKLGPMPSMSGMSSEVFTVENRDPDFHRQKTLQDHVERNFNRALRSLLNNNLIEPEGGINGANGFIRLSPEGKATKSLIDFEAIQLRSLLRDEMLHAKLRGKPLKDFRNGDLSSAVFEAFKIIEVEVRAAGNYPDTEIGVELMKKAFGQGGPLSDPAASGPARKAVENLFAGAIGKFKNPSSHTHRTCEVLEAMEELMFASRLLRHIDQSPKGP